MLEPILNDKNEPIHNLIDLPRTKELLTANSPTPWYGQLMTTPQTVAYFYMLNYWLKKYNVEIEI